jgi:predicted RNase H-like HicB family nuclease
MAIKLPVSLPPEVVGESLQTLQTNLQGFLAEYENKVAQARDQILHVEALLGSLTAESPKAKGKKKEFISLDPVVDEPLITEVTLETIKRRKLKASMIISVIIEWDEEAKAYSATCPELNFVSSFGDSHEEAIFNLKEAISLMLEPLPDYLLVKKPCSEMAKLAL